MTDDIFAELNQTLRKQGRAAIAAQAAAEESLETLRRVESTLATLAAPPPAEGDVEATMRALLPFVDALDRVASEAQRLQARPTAWIERPFSRHHRSELGVLARAVVLLQTQLDGIVEAWGVELDRATGIPLDAERHRVVEARPGARGGAPGTVIEVARVGCVVGGQRIRETDVIVAGGSR